MSAQPVQLLNLRDTAALLGVDESTVRRQIRSGALVACPIGRRILIHPIDLADYQQRLRCPFKDAKTVPMSSPFATTAGDIERLLGVGRTKMPASTKGRSKRKSGTLRVVASPND